MIVPLSTRLRQQRLVQPACRAAEDVVAWMGAVQAQEFAPARWALGQRMASALDADIEQAFNEGRILRTHILRPTWHFVHPHDIRWMLALSAPRVHMANGFSYRSEGLDAKRRLKGESVLARALEGGRHLTRSELADALKRARLPHAGQSLAGMVMHAELEGVICSGPRRGRQFTYALLDERVAPAPALSPDEALVELTRRYFTSHGPATIRDFTWWSGLTVAQARAGIDIAGDTLERIDIEGHSLWQAPGVRARPIRAPLVRLVPIYDEYLIAYRDREWVRSRVTSPAVTPGPNTFAHQLVVDGRVEGMWLPARASDGIDVRVTPYGSLSGAEHKALQVEVRRYGTFMGQKARLTLGQAD
jgi:hypothetical protein